MKDIVKKQINNKAQALVEFVILLPILLFIFCIIVDFGNVFYNKNHLEGVIDDVVSMVEINATQDEINKVINNKNVKYKVLYDDKYANVVLSLKVNLITPFASYVLDNPFEIKTERVILYE